MERYNYIVITKEECMSGDRQTVLDEEELHFDADKLNRLLSQYGDDGYRVITKLYNSPHDWVLILSRPRLPVRRAKK